MFSYYHHPTILAKYLENPVFQAIIATYHEQPCPLMAPVVGRFFGKKGTNSANMVQTWRQRHCLVRDIGSFPITPVNYSGRDEAWMHCIGNERAKLLLDNVGDPHTIAPHISTISHCIQTIARYHMQSSLIYIHLTSLLVNKQSMIAECLLLPRRYLKSKHTLHVQVGIYTTSVQLSHLIIGRRKWLAPTIGCSTIGPIICSLQNMLWEKELMTVLAHSKLHKGTSITDKQYQSALDDLVT